MGGDSDDSDDDDGSGDSDDDDSGDSDGSTDSDTNSESGDSDSGDDSSDNSNGSGTTTTTLSTTGADGSNDICAGLTGAACTENYDANGNSLCAANVVTQNCYSVVASSGIYGSGNYDDGFTAAQQTAEEQTQKLNTIVGVLAGIITVMALGIIGGAYYLHTKSKRMVQEQE